MRFLSALKTRLFILGLLCSHIIVAQNNPEPYFKKWYASFDNKKPLIESLDQTDSLSLGINLLTRRGIELIYEETKNETELVGYFTYQKKYKINSEKAFEEYNKLYINLNSAIELADIRVRVVKANGEVVITEKTELKEAENFEEYGHYQYLAISGIEVGCEVEYLYTIKKYSNNNGTQITIQNENDIKNFEFYLRSPINLEFDFKTTNGLPEPIRDSLDTTANHYSLVVDQIPGIKPESYSAYDRSTMSLLYKLGSNSALNLKRIVNFGKAASNVYSSFHGGFSSKDAAALSSISKKMKLQKMSQEDAIRTIEEYCKTKINIVNNSDEDLESISKILSNKVTNNTGVVKLYVNWIEHLKIPYELGLTCDRSEMEFDPKFESYHSMDMYFLYFKSLDKFCMPRVFDYRLGPLPPGFTNSYSLFMSPITLGEMQTYLPELRKVEPTGKDFTFTNLDIQVAPGSDFNNSQIKLKQTMAGHEAAYFQSNLSLVSEEDRKSLEREMVEIFRDNEELVSYTFENLGGEFLFKKPFVINSVLDYPSIITQAGNSYLMPVGKLIGPQSELYNENERKLDIELSYNHSYTRKIKIEIPEGFDVKNPEKLNIKKELKVEDETKMLFESTYEKVGSNLLIEVVEYYDVLSLKKDRYPEFQGVINAAANFNKVTLIFEKL